MTFSLITPHPSKFIRTTIKNLLIFNHNKNWKSNLPFCASWANIIRNPYWRIKTLITIHPFFMIQILTTADAATTTSQCSQHPSPTGVIQKALPQASSLFVDNRISAASEDITVASPSSRGWSLKRCDAIQTGFDAGGEFQVERPRRVFSVNPSLKEAGSSGDSSLSSLSLPSFLGRIVFVAERWFS